MARPVKEKHVFRGSTRVASATYDPVKRIIQVKFLDGPYWNFYECAATTWVRFTRAGSAGLFVREILERHRHGPA